ncbi:MAG TPA: hypothetical protein VFE47_02895 [Tepidisphaeraceae bacterium]|jgi:hypothetical protein|nr:hypothetical protein [Tepidisphaeraceae bacterium]
MTAKINNRRDILLLMLYSPGINDKPNEAVVGRTRLVKMLFLFRQEALSHFRRGTEIDESNFYQFFAWNFGPFSTQVYDDLTFFQLRGFIETSIAADEESLPESAAEWEKWFQEAGNQESDELDVYQDEELKLTSAGVLFAKKLYGVLSEPQRRLLKEFKARLVRAPLRAILKYVYSTYPDLTEKSKIKGEVLGNPF